MPLTRRQLLTIGGLSCLTFGLSATMLGRQWWNTPASAPYQNLSQQEAQMIMAISAAVFPAGAVISVNPNSLKLDHYFDSLLQQLPQMQEKLLKLLLNALNSAPYISFQSSFLAQSAVEQQRQVQDWLNHSNHLIRGAITSLIVLLGMGYSAHPEIAPYFGQMHQCGYGG